jgi:phosphodiesterase/alkaline phosphatase D-like protein
MLALAVVVMAGPAMGQVAVAEILGRPTDRSVTLSALFSQDVESYCQLGLAPGDYQTTTPVRTCSAGEPSRVVFTDLQPSTRYYYRSWYRRAGDAGFSSGDERTFHTQRAVGESFTFTIEADPHPYDKKGSHSLWRLALQNQLADRPDFVIDLGDTFGDDRDPASLTDARARQLHLATVPFFGLLCHSAPLFLCLGNHEGESGYYLLQTPPENLAAYGTRWRRFYYANPLPGGFYSGNLTEEANGLGLPQNYYAWQWGDALFVVLDAYRGYTASAKPRGWQWTLGETQYRWLKQTLESSRAQYKFVLAHHTLGEARGGVATSGLYEWGGYEANGRTWGFDTNRPGWGLPIHQLMVANGVNAFFQGHDHLYATEERDGLIYQEVPMPSDSTYTIGVTDNGDAYTATRFDGAGHVRVWVGSDSVRIGFVRAWLPRDESSERHNGEVVGEYSIQPRAGSGSGAGGGEDPAADTTAWAAGELLGRPTDRSVALNVMPPADGTVYADFGSEPTVYGAQTLPVAVAAGVPVTLVMQALMPNTRYYYRLRFRRDGVAVDAAGPERTFHTARPAGAAFTFAIEADPHLDGVTNAALYRRTLGNILEAAPDFLIDLGDTFMADKIRGATLTDVVDRHVLLRSFFDLVGHSAPLMLVLGNHEGESGWLLDGTENNLAMWATRTRLAYFPNPQPDGFYSGDTTHVAFVGQRQAYYAWEWGDALFVVLDPYWYTVTKPGSTQDNWAWTLGPTQYRWLAATLAGSQRRLKFVFAHQVVGGTDSQGRGGVEAASYFEMGGRNPDGSWGFADHRPGWPQPVHQLMVDNHVTAFFHGHDHVYVQQELDGIVYQEVPQPAYYDTTAPERSYSNANQAAAYGYASGTVLPSSGFLRVRVTPTGATVDYVRSYLPEHETGTRVNGEVARSYTLAAAAVATSVLSAGEMRVDEGAAGPRIRSWPNPVNSTAAITVELVQAADANLAVYDLLGQVVARLLEGPLPAGPTTVRWETAGRSSGLYLLRLRVGSQVETSRVLLVR